MKAIAPPLLLFCLLVATVSAAPETPHWTTLTTVERITFYGSRYVAGDITASGIRYAPDNDTVALGPALLGSVRSHYAAMADELGQPMFWKRDRGGRLVYGGIAGSFPVATSWDSAAWWGYMVRVCADAPDGVELCQVMRVADTGKPDLQIDLPDRTWGRWGWPAGQGVFRGRLEVWE